MVAIMLLHESADRRVGSTETSRARPSTKSSASTAPTDKKSFEAMSAQHASTNETALPWGEVVSMQTALTAREAQAFLGTPWAGS